jgi:threonylcarbamoyladenosine tRNA methylthiotransferase MtaB
LLEWSEQQTQAFYLRHVGMEKVVLLEKPKPGMPFHGFTDNYIRVEVSDVKSCHDNTLVKVRLGEFNEEKTALKATIIS